MKKKLRSDKAASDRGLAFLKSAPLLGRLSKAQEELLIENAHIEEHKKGSVIFFHSEPIECFYIILSGWVRLFRESTDGKESIVDLITRGDIVGEEAVFHSAQFSFSGQAVDGRVAVLEIPVRIMRKLMASDHKITMNMLDVTTRRVNQLRSNIERLTVMSAPQRVVSLLLKLYNGKDKTFLLPYDKSIAASYLGMKAETLSRVLNDLKKFGVKVNGSFVTIESIQQLYSYYPATLPEMGIDSKNQKEKEKFSRHK